MFHNEYPECGGNLVEDNEIFYDYVYWENVDFM